MVLENPRIRFEMVYQEVGSERGKLLIQYGVSWTEMISELRGQQGNLVDRYDALSDEINSDIYGRYSKGILSQNELQSYYEKLLAWKSASLALFEQYRRIKSCNKQMALIG